MLTKTSVSAIRVLIHLGLDATGGPISPRLVAEQLGESPSYLAKVTQQLARAGILRAHRGVSGGVTLNLTPDEITLLAIVEACQGAILADFCEEGADLAKTCAFHQAAAELHDAIVRVLSKWTLAELLENPRPSKALRKTVRCWLEPSRKIELKSPNKTA
jgi:Rrf2 family protein